MRTFKIKVKVSDDAKSVYYRIIEAENAADAEFVAAGDFASNGIETAEDVTEVSSNTLAKEIKEAEDILVEKAGHIDTLHDIIMKKDHDRILPAAASIADKSSSGKEKVLFSTQEVLYNLGPERMAEQLKSKEQKAI